MKATRLLAIAATILFFSSCNEAQKAEQKGISFDQVIQTRRSIRSYDNTKSITKEQLNQLFIATQQAPSWANQQPSKYYVATSNDKVDAVRELIGGNKDRTAGATVFIVSTFERGKSGFFRGEATNEVGDGWGAYDNGLSNGYLVLQARAMGFDTLIMGMRDSDGLRSLFNIPENETIMAVIALGYRAEDPKEPTHRELNDVVLYF